jgi:predicted amidohydrolase YtcJ
MERCLLPADLALLNANVHTLNPRQPKAQAVAISKGKIIKVGTNQQIKLLVGEKTRVLDLEGKTVLPGLIDTHIHVTDFGRCLMWLDLSCAQSIGELQALVAEKAKSTAKGRWVIGQGWNETRFKEKRMPTASELDLAASDNPVILYREAAMVCATNSRAMQVAGVTEETHVPLGGAAEKDSNGKLTGIFRDTATSLIWQAVPEPTEEELLEATAYACRKVAQAGITSVHWLVLSEAEIAIIQKLHVQGKLPFRVYVVVPQQFLPKTADFKTDDSWMLRLGGATVNVDGYLDSKEAALLEPYSDDSKNTGKLFLSEEGLAAAVGKVLALNLQPVVLAMGDRAVDTTLKVIEQNKGKARLRIEQAALLNQSLLDRLRRLDVVVSVQPKMVSTEFTVWSAMQRLGVERAKWLHPLKTLIDAGVHVAGGSDCPMEPLNPLLGVQELVLREQFPEQRLSVSEALQMYTVDAAYASGEETLKGTIEEGNLADFTVLSADLETVAPDKIKDIKVELTILGGKPQTSIFEA